VTDGKIIEHPQGDMIEVTIKRETEGTETLNFIDALTDHLGIIGMITQVHRITIMIHIKKVMIT